MITVQTQHHTARCKVLHLINKDRSTAWEPLKTKTNSNGCDTHYLYHRYRYVQGKATERENTHFGESI